MPCPALPCWPLSACSLPHVPVCLPACRLSSIALFADILVPGLMPGQIASPVRLGRARQGIFSPMLPELAGLDAERIVQVGAGGYWWVLASLCEP